MNELFVMIGALLLVLGILDFIWTTLWVDGGAGPLTDRLSTVIWKVLRKVSGDHPKILSISGPVILSMTLLMWIILLWAGWTLVFSGNGSAIVHSQDQSPATWTERIYFTGYLIFTLGNGDFTPRGAVWQIATVLATGTGMLFITLGVTYLLSVLGAVTHKRSFAESVHGVGKSGKALVKNSWNGRHFHNADLLLNELSSQLSRITAQHKAYPILHYYYAEDKNESVPSAVVILDDALTIYHFGMQQEYQPNQLLVAEARSSIQSYLNTLQAAKISPASGTTHSIDIEDLQKSGYPTVAKEDFRQALDGLGERREKLHKMLQANALEWPTEE